jgi:hypothetical protein
MRIISRIGTPSASFRWRSTVSWRAERISLSHRRALKNGSFLIAATSFVRPAITPACGPPSSLSPLNTTRSTPFFSTSPAVGSCSPPPSASVRKTAPVPRSSTNGTFFAFATAAISSVGGDSTKPPMKKLLRCTFSTSAVAFPTARA